MKIILGSTYHFSQYTAGNERYAHQLALGLESSGHQVIYATSSPIQTTLTYPYTLLHLPLFSLLNHPFYSFSWFRFALTTPGEIFHACGSGLPLIISALIFRLRGFKTIFTFPAPFHSPKLWLKPFIWLLETLVYPLAFSGYLTTQPLNQTYLQTKYPSKRVFCAWLNLSQTFLSQNQKKQSTFRFPQSRGKTKLLMVTKLDHHHYYKGVDVALQAMKLLPDHFHLYLIGSGDCLVDYQKQAQELQISHRVYFLGHLPDEQLPSAYRAADVFLFPSVSDAEGFGLSLFEAMSQFTPTLTTTAIGLYPYLKKLNLTQFIPPASAQKLSHGIKKITTTPNHTIVKLAAAFTQKLTLSRMTQETLQAYQSL